MASNKRYGIYPSRVGDIVFRQLGEAIVMNNATKSEPVPGGALDRGGVVTAFMGPMARFRSTDFTGLFGGGTVVSITTGYVADTTLGSPTAATILQYQQRQDGGTFKSGNTDPLVITSNKGFLYIDEITAEQDSVEGAVVTMSYAMLSTDGITTPYTIAPASGGLTSTPTWNGIWYLGPVLIGTVGSGTIIDGLRSVTIKPAIEYRAKRQDGSPFPMLGSIHSRLAEISFGFENLEQLYTYWPTIYGQAVAGTGTQLAFYFQKGLAGGARTGFATAAHVRVLAALGGVDPDQISVTGNDDVGFTCTMRLTTTLALAHGVAIA